MIPRFRPNFGIAEILRSLGHGRRYGVQCRALETPVARHAGARHAVLAPSGRGALFLLLHCLPSGRVVVPGFTCSAVAEAAALAGREVVYLEHGGASANLVLADVEGRLRPGDIFILTHQYGYPADVDALCRLAHNCGALVVEDIAAAFCNSSGGRPLGSFGDAAFGSFDVSKLLHAPMKGGFAVTSDADLAGRLEQEAARLFTPMPVRHRAVLVLKALLLCVVTHPWAYRAFHFVNFRLAGRATAEDGRLATERNGFYRWSFADWQAWLVLRQFARLDAILRRRADIHARYRARLEGHGVIRQEPVAPETEGAPARFPVYVEGDKMQVAEQLRKAGVDCGFSFTTLATPRSHAGSWRIAGSVLNLPLYARLSDRELQRVVDAVDAIGGRAHAG